MIQRLLKASLIIICLSAAVTGGISNGQPTPPAAKFETRCGWFSNPTPANIWLNDKDGEWTIGVQGGYQVEGDWDWPEFKPGQWVITNAASYGYGCACFDLRVNKRTHKVLEIKSARARPLSSCRRDPSLKKWKEMFK
jgi:hypothetical protein